MLTDLDMAQMTDHERFRDSTNDLENERQNDNSDFKTVETLWEWKTRKD